MLPLALGDVLLARVERLDRSTQRLLRVAAAGGRAVWDRLLAAVAGLEESELEAALREAVEHHVLVVDEAEHGYVFRHALTRDGNSSACEPAALVVFGLLATSFAAGPALAERSRAVRVDTVCFRVHNGSDQQASTLFGKRYRVGRTTSRTPAIVLVHGVASSTANWDFLPRLSVARSLARHGYVVISYDRLGFARSVYHGAGGGKSITSLNQQAMLHEVVRAVHRGAYALGRGSTAPARRRRGRSAPGAW